MARGSGSKSESLSSVGALIGLVGAVWATHLFEHFLFGVGGHDPATYLAVFGILMLVCLAAAYVPAMRVLKISPREILAEE